MVINIQDDILKIQSYGLTEKLLTDKTTKKKLIWGTDAYAHLGYEYERDKEITTGLVTGRNAGVIKTRARKAMEQQNERTRQHAEVFTPLWVCKKMNDYADEVNTKKKSSLKEYVDLKILEITCGEAPFLVSRYDVATGEMIPVGERIGILDRKLKAVCENLSEETEKLEFIIRAFQSVYGYEFQGDNVLIARTNLFMTFEEYLHEYLQRDPTIEEQRKILNIITWNIWQMDGLTGRLPYCKAEEDNHQISFNEWLGIETGQKKEDRQPQCRIYDWRSNKSIIYNSMKE